MTNRHAPTIQRIWRIIIEVGKPSDDWMEYRRTLFTEEIIRSIHRSLCREPRGNTNQYNMRSNKKLNQIFQKLFCKDILMCKYAKLLKLVHISHWNYSFFTTKYIRSKTGSQNRLCIRKSAAPVILKKICIWVK